MYNWTQGADAGRSALRGLRARLHVVSIMVDRKAIGDIHDTFLDTLQAETEGVANLVAVLAFVSITEEYIRASARSGADLMDLDATRGPYPFAESTIMSSEAADNEKINTFFFLEAFQSKVDDN